MDDSTLTPSMLSLLEQAHTSNDASVLLRQRKILELCSGRDYTVDELAEHFGMNYYTLYRNVKELVLIQLLQVQASKQGGKHLYRTNWNLVRESGEELSLRLSTGKFAPISKLINTWLGNSHIAAEKFESVGEILCANWYNKKARSQGLPNYGESHEIALRAELAEKAEWFRNLADMIEQAITSPIMTDDRGFEMYKLPPGADGSVYADKWEHSLQQSGYYDRAGVKSGE